MTGAIQPSIMQCMGEKTSHIEALADADESLGDRHRTGGTIRSRRCPPRPRFTGERKAHCSPSTERTIGLRRAYGNPGLGVPTRVMDQWVAAAILGQFSHLIYRESSYTIIKRRGVPLHAQHVRSSDSKKPAFLSDLTCTTQDFMSQADLGSMRRFHVHQNGGCKMASLAQGGDQISALN